MRISLSAQCLIGIKASAGGITQRAKLYFPGETTRGSRASNDDDNGNVSVGLEIVARRLRISLSDTQWQYGQLFHPRFNDPSI